MKKTSPRNSSYTAEHEIGETLLASEPPPRHRVAATLTTADEAGTAHQVEVQLPPSYPASAPRVTAALPKPFAVVWPPSTTANGRLGGVLEQFQTELTTYSRLWQELATIDTRWSGGGGGGGGS